MRLDEEFRRQGADDDRAVAVQCDRHAVQSRGTHRPWERRQDPDPARRYGERPVEMDPDLTYHRTDRYTEAAR